MTHRMMIRPWCPDTIPLTESAEALVTLAVEDQFLARQSRQAALGKKARRNKGDDARKERSTVAAIVLDVLAHHQCGDPMPFIIKLDHNWLSSGSVEQVARNRSARERVDYLFEAGWVECNTSFRFNNRYMTRLQAGPRLLEAAESLQVGLADIGCASLSPAIELKGHKAKDGQRLLLPIPETPWVDTIKAQLAGLQSRLDHADLGCANDTGVTIDTRRRSVSRIFLDGSLERGGRLGGPAFWLNLPRDQRRSSLRIEGEPIAEVDLRAAIPTIAYACVGAKPDGDPYELPNAPDIPREAVKKVLMQLFWSKLTPELRLPREPREMIPRHYKAKEVYRLIMERNAPIAGLLGQAEPLGARLQWYESEIIIEATLRCFSAGIQALPLHDALLVPLSVAEDAQRVLSEVFFEKMGQSPIATVECFEELAGAS